MNHTLRLLVIGALIACGIIMVALGFVRDDANLMAPVNLMLFLLGAVLYLLPTALAVYRDCKATIWIAVVNVLLGWTVFGWFVAIGWAAKGQIQEVSRVVAPPPSHPVPGH